MANNAHLQKVLGTSPIRYWPILESTGTTIADYSTNGDDGTAAGGLTLGASGIGDGHTAATLDGTDGQIDIYSADLNTDFDGQLGSAAVWFRVTDSDVWTDSTARFMLSIRVGTNNYIFLQKTANDNQLRCTYKAGGTTKTVAIANSATTWQMLSMSWDLSGDAMKAYINGAQSGATQDTLGTWAGSLDSARCVIGDANTTAAYPWSGDLAHAAVWDAVIDDDGMAALYVINRALNPQHIVYKVKPRVHFAGV